VPWSDPMTANTPRRDAFLMVGASALVVLWRLVSQPLALVWRDWLLILALYWLFTTVARTSRVWTTVTLATMASLLGIYVAGQMPHILAVWGRGG
jgi:hypothetical protein